MRDENEHKGVSRREFLKIAGVAGAAVGLAGGLGGILSACGEESTTTTAGVTTTAGATTTVTAGTTTTAAATTTSASVAGSPSWDELKAMSPDQAAEWGAKLYPYPDVRGPGATTELPLRSWNPKSGIPFGDAFPVKENGVVDTSKYKKQPPWRVGFSNSSMAFNWRVIMYEMFMYRAGQYPDEIGEVIVTQADDNMSKQLADIEDLTAKKVDILVISAGVEDALVPAIERAYDQGIPVVVFDRDVATDKYTANVRLNEIANGKAMGDFLGKAMGGKGTLVGLLGMAGSSNAIDRWAGCQEALKAYPGVEIAHAEYAKAFNVAESQALMQGFIAAEPQIDGIYAMWLTESLGALAALKEAGRPVPPLTGAEGNGELQIWKELAYPGYHISNPAACSIDAVDVAVLTLRGEPIYRDYFNGLFEITNETLDLYYRPDLSGDWLATPRFPEELAQKYFAKK